LILWIIMLCYYSSTYCILLNSLPYNRNARYKYLPCMANTNIQIYSIYKYISLINPYLNYNYWNKLIPRIQTGLELVTCIIWLQVPPFTEAARRLITMSCGTHTRIGAHNQAETQMPPGQGPTIEDYTVSCS
jgi:hypothetical protein